MSDEKLELEESLAASEANAMFWCREARKEREKFVMERARSTQMIECLKNLRLKASRLSDEINDVLGEVLSDR